jgi:hypothetical protein
MAGIIPVARQVGTADHACASFGRSVAEAVFWAPAALLPGSNMILEEAGPDGQPLQVVFNRWSNENPEKAYQFQPFCGYFSEFRTIQGHRIPTHVETGNFFGTDAYFPFFVVDVPEISFLQ